MIQIVILPLLQPKMKKPVSLNKLGLAAYKFREMEFNAVQLSNIMI